MKTVTVLVLLMICAGSLPLWAEPGPTVLDGAYQFVRLETPDGPVQNQQGMMILSSGYLCQIRVPMDRPKLTDGLSDEEKTKIWAEGFRSANSTCGSYSLEGPNATVSWNVALDPAIQDNVSKFIFESEGEYLKVAPAAAPEFKFVYKKH